MNIGILGGTFDPVHTGHLTLARYAQKQYHLDKVLFIPVFIPPHKTGKPDLTPALHRYRMVELALRDEKDFELSDIELVRQGISYTVDTLKTLKKKYPHDRLFLILGADNFTQLSTWRDSGEIRKLVSFLVSCRPGFDKPASNRAGVQWIDMPDMDVSASTLRRQISEAKPLSPDAIPVAVEAYIRRIGLYGGDRS